MTSIEPRPLVVDKHGRLAQLGRNGGGSLELGCGPVRLRPDAIGVDALDHPGVDVVGDVFHVLEQVPTGSIREIHSSHFLEHVNDLDRLIREFERVLAPGGIAISVVPHFSNPYFYSDPTHRRFFGLYSMSYYAHDRVLRRRVPRYVEAPGLELCEVKLRFRSPFRIRYALRLPFEWLINLTRWGQEFYEEFLTPFIYCYEIEFFVRKVGPRA